MNVATAQLISYAAFSLAGLSAAVAVFLFFADRIPEVIGNVSGRTARKAIADIRRFNETSGEKKYQPSRYNLMRGRITDKITASGNLVPGNSQGAGGGASTDKLSTDLLAAKASLAGTDITSLLSPEEEETSWPVPPESTVEVDITFIPADEEIGGGLDD